MRRTLAALFLVMAVAAVAGIHEAAAHECQPVKKGSKKQTCHATPVVPNWRGSYIPLFGVNDVRCDVRDKACHDRRAEQQRWRDEWGCDTQYCFWFKWGQSAPPFGDGSPQSIHTGMAADHSMTEDAHSAQGHGTDEGNHDTHGGSVFVDLCLASDQGTSYQGKPGACAGPRDTQVGFNIVDHDPCGPPQPGDIPVPCSDEYHVIRPLDPEYTQEQNEQDRAEIQRYAENPGEWLCGYKRKDDARNTQPVPQNPPCDMF
jgi:hypothetical protein